MTQALIIVVVLIHSTDSLPVVSITRCWDVIAFHCDLQPRIRSTRLICGTHRCPAECLSKRLRRPFEVHLCGKISLTNVHLLAAWSISAYKLGPLHFKVLCCVVRSQKPTKHRFPHLPGCSGLQVRLKDDQRCYWTRSKVSRKL